MIRTAIIATLTFILFIACGDDNPDTGGGNGNELETFEPVAVTKSNPMKVWVHYMPWFEDKTTGGGKWGQHWTMANRNPDITDANGKRQIAAHYYPLIGPYASSDTDVLEYHFLLMKYAGIDGILIDWYGTRNYADYAENRRNTEAIVAALEKVGLDFAIVYEDRTLENGFDNHALRISQAVSDMEYLEKNFFKKSNYIKIDNNPLLLNFGPIILKTPSDWNKVFQYLPAKPAFFPLCYHSSMVNDDQFKNGIGEYIWVDGDEEGMKTKYRQKERFEEFIGGAYPGFHDYYKEGGWGNTVLNRIDHENGRLFDRLLKMAQDENMKYLQLITWNDFGEGTMIEPTQEFGYIFLESIQRFTGVAYNKSHLEAIYSYFNSKKQSGEDGEKKKQLLQAYYYFISLQSEKAMDQLKEINN